MDISTHSDLCALQDVIYHKELCDLPVLYLLFLAGIIKNIVLLPAMLMLLGICFITTIKVKKPHTIGKIMMIAHSFEKPSLSGK